MKAFIVAEVSKNSVCSRCGAAIAFNPHRPHQDTPRRCMQCADITPLPIES